MNEHFKAITLFVFLFVLLSAAGPSRAALALHPVTPGYSSGSFSSPSGSYTGTGAANDSYIKPSTTNVNGKSVTVPAKMRMAANAGQYAKSAMRANPLLLAGSLALPWLLDQGMEWAEDVDQWMKKNPNTWVCPSGVISTQLCYPSQASTGGYGASKKSTELWPHQQMSPQPSCGTSAVNGYTGITGSTSLSSFNATANGCGVMYRPSNVSSGTSWNFACYTWCTVPVAKNPSNPATDEDWNALPDPIPTVAPELPYAPYAPAGAPVDAPYFDFSPMTVPVGEPYSKPDGSTAQPMAKISPNGDMVTVDTYDQPLTDPQGNPLPDAAPQDTLEPAPDPDICAKNPDSLMCAKLGTIPEAELVPTTELPIDATVTSVGGQGQCPANVSLPHGITWSYEPICNFASAIKPFILGFAWLTFAFIVAGVSRS